MKLLNIFASLLVFISLTSCDLRDRKQEATQIADVFYQHISQQDFANALSLCSDDFYVTASKDEWIKALEAINKKYGNYKKHHLLEWNMHNTPGGDIRSAEIGAAYRVIYQHGETIETINMSGPKQLRIISYAVIPDKRQPRK